MRVPHRYDITRWPNADVDPVPCAILAEEHWQAKGSPNVDVHAMFTQADVNGRRRSL